ncbi:hypothetical protein JNUCC1_03243 [Lentibacillus sp. JNUCC-1]|uniref:dUTP diphosphatase n=1 Tax=Lentibacillus sp. JNUCC-1 TaxID=2654513 RepID=UPI0012E77374|nr:dUTP diphosphatase [Lentibacillus sp. JNUCC-1]MUV39367.1 hypothetical protein [Lentibacillus sp. JNUCC-1]
MNWDELYAMQKELDDYIKDNHQLEGHHLDNEKILALLVELGELANETRCFKFWSNKPPSPKSVVQEEYVDGIHFLMSIGIDQGYRYQPTTIQSPANDLTTQFNHVFSICTLFNQQPKPDLYQQLFVAYLELGKLLEIGEADIYEAYMAKNKTNYSRQDQGY